MIKNLAIAVIGIVVAGVLYITMMSFSPVTQNPGAMVCTADAMQCPDGSYVGRTGPNCEFAACPNATTTPQ